MREQDRDIPDIEAREESVNPRANPMHHQGYLFIWLHLQKIKVLRCATPGLSESNPTSGKRKLKRVSVWGAEYVVLVIE